MKRLAWWGVLVALAGLVGAGGFLRQAVRTGEGSSYVFLVMEEHVPGPVPEGWGEEAFQYLWSPTERELLVPGKIADGRGGISMILHLVQGEGPVRGRLWTITRGGEGVRLVATGDRMVLKRAVGGRVLLEFGGRSFWLSPGESWGARGSVPAKTGRGWALRLFNLGLWPAELADGRGGSEQEEHPVGPGPDPGRR